MTNLEAADLLDNLIGMVSDNHNSDYDEALSKGRDILKSEPCYDCVSRAKVVEFLRQHTKDFVDARYRMAYMSASSLIENTNYVPPVTPQPKTGRWITVNKGLKVTSYKCSECGRTVGDDTGYDVTKDYPYCHCGAKMQEVEEQVVTQQAFDAEYERGLEDAWKVAREVIRMDSTQQFEIFGEHGDINVLDLKSATEAMKLYEEHKEKQKTLEQDRACSILDDDCPYPHLGCHECEVYCVMERANKKLEERNYMP